MPIGGLGSLAGNGLFSVCGVRIRAAGMRSEVNNDWGWNFGTIMAALLLLHPTPAIQGLKPFN